MSMCIIEIYLKPLLTRGFAYDMILVSNTFDTSMLKGVT